MKDLTKYLIGIGFITMIGGFSCAVYEQDKLKEKELNNYQNICLGISLIGTTGFLYGMHKFNKENYNEK
jgi:hypothetical protein